MQTIDINASDTGLKHLSFSAVRDYLRNPRMFRKRWIDLDFEREPQLPLIEGSAFHAGVEVYWGQVYAGLHLDSISKRGMQIDLEEMKAHALRRTEMECAKGEPLRKRIAKKDVPNYEGCTIETEVTQTKTGRKSEIYYLVMTPEAIAKGIDSALEGYVGQRDHTVYTPLAIELAHTAVTVDPETGKNHPFPLKARVDLIARHEGELVIVDHKYNGDDPEEDEDGNLIATPAMKLQAACYESIAPAFLKELGIEGEIHTVIFDIMNKKTGKMSQVKITVGEKERVMWARIFRGVQQAILLAYAVGDYNSAFLPNPDDWSKDGWAEFERDVEFSLDTGESVRKAEKKATEEYEAYDL